MKKIFVLTAVVIASLLCVASCGSSQTGQSTEAQQPAEIQQGDAQIQVADQLVILIGANASTFDPHKCSDSNTEMLNKNIYSGLVQFDKELSILPDLAYEWLLADDDLTWTFRLREGVTFHDGSAFNAQSVKFSFERALAEETASPRRYVLESISEINVLSDYEVQIVTSYPNGAFLQQMAHPVAGIVSQAAVDAYGEDYVSHPTGCGPFKFVEWSVGERVVLERNMNYYNGAPMVEKLIFNVVPDDTTRSLLMQSGEADVALRLPSSDVQRLEKTGLINVISDNSVMTMFVAMNGTKPALDDVRVRQAMNYAIDKEAIISQALNGMATVADCPMSPVTWGYNSIFTYEHNVEKAKALLAEAGYADGLELTLQTAVGRYLQDVQVCQIMQEMWAKAGITVHIEQWEYQALQSEMKKGEFDMLLLGWSPSTGEANQALYPTLHSSQWPPNYNRAHYANETVDSLLLKGQQTIDPDERMAAYKEAETIIMDEAPWVFLYYVQDAIATGSNVEGVIVLPTEHILFKDVFIK